jgi:hypothetical protein
VGKWFFDVEEGISLKDLREYTNVLEVDDTDPAGFE